jgi:hypothetical protein
VYRQMVYWFLPPIQCFLLTRNVESRPNFSATSYFLFYLFFGGNDKTDIIMCSCWSTDYFVPMF